MFSGAVFFRTRCISALEILLLSYLLTYLLTNTTEEINVQSKAECVQLNLAHVARKKI